MAKLIVVFLSLIFAVMPLSAGDIPLFRCCYPAVMSLFSARV
jgi:hypothetical protein